MIKKIVLTGGPCAGKTTVLSKISNELKERGYKVFVVNESATELINGGITPHKDGLGMFNFQKLILAYQYQKEEIYNIAISGTLDEDIVVIYDRGLLDNRAYITEEEFLEILRDFSKSIGKNLNVEEILLRYDMVIHLETSANSKGYNLDSNNARYESREAAIILDKRTIDSWIRHNNLYVVKSTESFIDKVDEVMMLIYKCLEQKESIKKRKKTLN